MICKTALSVAGLKWGANEQVRRRKEGRGKGTLGNLGGVLLNNPLPLPFSFSPSPLGLGTFTLFFLRAWGYGLGPIVN